MGNEQVDQEKKYMRIVEDIIPYLDKYGINNVSRFLIISHIKEVWDDSIRNNKENYKNIVKSIILQRISQRRRQLLIHSCLYYHFDTNIISDFDYDRIANELTALQERFPKISQEAPMYKVFSNWGEDGSTSGYLLPYNNIKVIEKAKRTIELNRWYKKNG